MAHQKIKEATWRRLFQIGIGLKGIKALGQLVLGVGILLASKASLDNIFSKIIASNLFKSAGGFVNGYAAVWALRLTGIKTFAAWYIIAHGAINLFVVVSLYLNKLWAYMLMMLFTLAFLVYQFYQIIFFHSYWLGIVTVYDIILLALIWHEYKYNKGRFSPGAV